MPVRNDGSIISKCLSDIKNQTTKDYELIIVDDGSTDNTSKLLELASRDDPRIRTIRTEPRGIISALNTGLSECTGNYVARMDADDRMHKTRLEKQFKFMQLNPGLDLIGCKVKGFTEIGSLSESIFKYQSRSNSLITHEQIERDLFAESPIMHPTFFAKKEFFLKIGGYANNKWAEDYDTILRAYGKGLKFGKHSDILVEKYHDHSRLSRSDVIYKRPAMFAAKVNFLLDFGMLNNRRGVMIVGSGPTGRQVSKSFENRGVRVLGFVDNRPGPQNRKVLNLPAWGFHNLPSPEFIEQFRDALIILAIGDSKGQSDFSDFLLKRGFLENFDFVRVIYNWPPVKKILT